MPGADLHHSVRVRLQAHGGARSVPTVSIRFFHSFSVTGGCETGARMLPRA
jgi:hypothetical protein